MKQFCILSVLLQFYSWWAVLLEISLQYFLWSSLAECRFTTWGIVIIRVFECFTIEFIIILFLNSWLVLLSPQRRVVLLFQIWNSWKHFGGIVAPSLFGSSIQLKVLIVYHSVDIKLLVCATITDSALVHILWTHLCLRMGLLLMQSTHRATNHLLVASYLLLRSAVH